MQPAPVTIRSHGPAWNGRAPSTVGEYILRANTAGLSWPLPETLDERALERRLLPAAAVSAPVERRRRSCQPAWFARTRGLGQTNSPSGIAGSCTYDAGYLANDRFVSRMECAWRRQAPAVERSAPGSNGASRSVACSTLSLSRSGLAPVRFSACARCTCPRSPRGPASGTRSRSCRCQRRRRTSRCLP